MWIIHGHDDDSNNNTTNKINENGEERHFTRAVVYVRRAAEGYVSVAQLVPLPDGRLFSRVICFM